MIYFFFFLLKKQIISIKALLIALSRVFLSSSDKSFEQKLNFHLTPEKPKYHSPQKFSGELDSENPVFLIILDKKY
jgi:hypothetical protein